MSTFLRVIRTKILYKIPLKFLLVLLVIVAIFIACFSSAIEIEGRIVGSYQTDSNGYGEIGSVSDYDFICLKTTTSSCNTVTITDSVDTSNYVSGNPYDKLICLQYNSSHLLQVQSVTNRTCSFGVLRLNLESAQESICVPMTSLECQTEYSLIPISSVDQNYCTTNNLCPSQECSVSTGVSTLYINDILHVGSPFIYMSIPEEIGWNYDYSQGGTNMNINVSGYNVDYDKIEDMITVQNYKPTSEDFSKIFSNFSDFGGLLVATLFIIILFYFIKKLFK